jgi:CheY-like chemotaxis protein
LTLAGQIGVAIGWAASNGFEVGRRLRALPHSRNLALIALTGWRKKMIAGLRTAIVFNHHLVKPVDVDTLRVFLTDVRRPLTDNIL